MLMGLVTKNGILLIDFVNKEREAGRDRRTAILNSARIRVRPIIMTTAAMIFGMLPLAFALGEGAEQRAPMAHAVIGGLITSTLLTLFIVPVVYSMLDDLSARVLGRKPPMEPVPVAAD
jgi:HAE1 family hydrophobic/amphiphilic exporter-1